MSFNVRKHITILLLKSENPGDPTEKYIVKTLIITIIIIIIIIIIIFFYLSFLSSTFTIHRTPREGEVIYLKADSRLWWPNNF